MGTCGVGGVGVYGVREWVGTCGVGGVGGCMSGYA